MVGTKAQRGDGRYSIDADLRQTARRAAVLANAAVVESDQLSLSALRDLEAGALQAIRRFEAHREAGSPKISATADELQKIASDATLQVDRRRSLGRRLIHMSEEASLWLYAVVADHVPVAASRLDVALFWDRAGPWGEEGNEVIGRRLAVALQDRVQQQEVRQVIRDAAQKAANEMPGKPGVSDWQDIVQTPHEVALVQAFGEVWRNTTGETPWAGNNPRNLGDSPGPPFWIFVRTVTEPLPILPSKLPHAYAAAAGWGIARGKSGLNKKSGPGRPRKTAADYRPELEDSQPERKPRRRRRGLTWQRLRVLAGDH